ncbi:protein transporter SEC24 [Cryptococcus neoformans Bt63]|nr:protein transporter SEC24 [Cryptococcus neoformans var. grubii Bt63]
MAPRTRYAIDPSLTGRPLAPAPQQQQWQQPEYIQAAPPGYQPERYQQQAHLDPNSIPQLHNVPEKDILPSGPYAPTQSNYPAIHPSQQLQPKQQQEMQSPRATPPPNHIPQPPHSSGPTMSGMRVRIDPSQVPNPIEAQELDQNLYEDEDFLSCQTRGLIPLVGTDYRGVDQGNSLPRHLRATLPCIPSNGQLLDTTALPFGVLVQPFAPLRYDEAPVPCVSSWVSGQSAFDPPAFKGETWGAEGEGDEQGLPRCDKCRGYINPWIRFVDGGRKWTCNLCGGLNEVPSQYFCHLAPNGQRLDHAERPELQFGTVDFPVPPSYWAQQPPSGSLLDSIDSDALASTAHDLLGGLQASLGQSQPHIPTGKEQREKEREKEKERKKFRKPTALSRVFVLDVSAHAGESGVARQVCEGIRKAIYGSKESGNEEEELLEEGQRIGFVSVGETVSFWNLSSHLHAPSQAVVSDLDDMFIPFTAGFLVDPQESRAQIERLLELLPNLAEQGREGGRVAAGSAVVGALAGLKHTGGQINLFLTSLTTHGLGTLTTRENPDYYNTDKERTLFTPSEWYLTTADQLAEAGVGVNLFLFPSAYTDIASLGALAAGTGGETFFHPRFDVVRDREKIHSELLQVLTRETAYNVTVRVRCSNGLRVSDHLGNFYQRSLTDLEYATIDSAKSFTAVLKHEHRLDDRQPAFIQVAILYTSKEGERRVRCLNMSFVVTSMIGNVFKFADQEACVAVLLKAGLSQVTQRSLRDIRKSLTDRANRVLLMYRKHCAPAVQHGQLILPEGFKLLPLYALCMTKSKPIKGGSVSSDVRMHYTRHIKALSPTRVLMLLYPRLLAIHDLTPTAGFADSNTGRLVLPRFMRNSHSWMVAEGAYLMINGEIAMLWLGQAVSPQIINDLYGVDNLEDLDIRITRLPNLPTLLSTQIRNILTHLSSPHLVDQQLPVIIVRQNMDGAEVEFANQLVEDSNNDALSYTDYLMTAHREITNDLSGGKGDSWRPW